MAVVCFGLGLLSEDGPLVSGECDGLILESRQGGSLIDSISSADFSEPQSLASLKQLTSNGYKRWTGRCHKVGFPPVDTLTFAPLTCPSVPRINSINPSLQNPLCSFSSYMTTMSPFEIFSLFDSMSVNF